MKKRFSIIIPAHNEMAQISSTLAAVLDSVADLTAMQPSEVRLEYTPVEVIVVDNIGTDGTADRVRPFVAKHGVLLARCSRLKAACARNWGVPQSSGTVLVFVDADTQIPANALRRIQQHTACGKQTGILGLAPQESGVRARCWWAFWNCVRRLPLARAKALPAFMFCTHEAFAKYGPFDERVETAEELPILAGVYRHDRKAFIYDAELVAHSSSRRMTLRRFGYARTFLKYLWAILHVSGRIQHSHEIRQADEYPGSE